MDNFYEWTSTDELSYLHGRDVKSAFEKLLSGVGKSPVNSEACVQSGKCHPTITKWSMMALVGGAMENEVGNFTIWKTAMATQSTGQPYSYRLGCLDYHTTKPMGNGRIDRESRPRWWASTTTGRPWRTIAFFSAPNGLQRW